MFLCGGGGGGGERQVKGEVVHRNGRGPISPNIPHHTRRSLAPAWPRLHSLHISYTALPPTADLVLDAFRALPALRHLSLYASPDAALDQHTSGKVCEGERVEWGGGKGVLSECGRVWGVEGGKQLMCQPSTWSEGG